MNVPNVTDLNKVDQTTYKFTISNSYSTNLVTKFIEYSTKKISNVAVYYINIDGSKEGRKPHCIVSDNNNVNGGVIIMMK